MCRFNWDVLRRLRVLLTLAASAVAVILLQGAACCAAESRRDTGGEPGHDWPMVGRDAGGTGLSPDARVRPPFRLRWAVQPGYNGKHDIVVADGKVFTPRSCLDAETGDVLWNSGLPGAGTAPSYHRGRLYAMGKGSVMAYNAADGQLVWKKSGYSMPYFPPRAGLPVCDGAVYVCKFAEHQGKRFYFAVALDAVTGDELWATPLLPASGQAAKGYELGDRVGVAAVAGGRVFISTHSPRMVCALDQKSGDEIWRQEGLMALSAVSSDGGLACAADQVQGVWTLNATTGEKLWQWGSSDLSREKANYLTTGTAKRPPVITDKIVVTSNYGRRYTALDSATGELRWVTGGGDPRSYNMWVGGCGTPSIAGGHAYSTGLTGAEYSGHRFRFGIYAVATETGKPAWRHPISGKSCGRVAVAGGRLYTRAGITEIVCFEPVPAGWKPTQPQPDPDEPAALPAAMARPFGGKAGEAAAGGKPAGGSDWPMYGGCPERCGLELKIALPIREAWRFATGGKVKSSPVIRGGLVYAGSDSGSLFALELATGKEKWQAAVACAIRSAPAVAADVVVCGAEDGVLRAFDAATGAPRWQFRTGGPIGASPAIVPDPTAPAGAAGSNRVVFGSWDGRCYCVRLSDGKEYWRYRVGDPGVRVHTSPAVAADRVYVGAWEDFAVTSLDLGTGKPLAGFNDNTPARGVKYSSLGLVQGLAVYRGLLFTWGDRGGCALDGASGRIVAQTSGMAERPALPVFGLGGVCFASSPRLLPVSERIADQENAGWKFRRESFRHPVIDAPLISDNLMIAATAAGTIEVRRLPDAKSDGPTELLWEWQSESGAEMATSPAAADGFIVVGADDGNLYGFSYGIHLSCSWGRRRGWCGALILKHQREKETKNEKNDSC